jgi:hypothetical protein
MVKVGVLMGEEYSIKLYVFYSSALRKNDTTTFETSSGCGRTRIPPVVIVQPSTCLRF